MRTGLFHDINISLVSTPGYRLFGQDRSEGRGGGVGSYDKECIYLRQIKINLATTISNIDSLCITANI